MEGQVLSWKKVLQRGNKNKNVHGCDDGDNDDWHQQPAILKVPETPPLNQDNGHAEKLLKDLTDMVPSSPWEKKSQKRKSFPFSQFLYEYSPHQDQLRTAS